MVRGIIALSQIICMIYALHLYFIGDIGRATFFAVIAMGSFIRDKD